MCHDVWLQNRITICSTKLVEQYLTLANNISHNEMASSVQVLVTSLKGDGETGGQTSHIAN